MQMQSTVPVPESIELQDKSSTVITSYFDQLSPRTQTFIKRLMGLGVSLYIIRVIITSPEFKIAISRLTNWGSFRISALPFVKSAANLKSHDSTFSLLMELPGKIRRTIWTLLPPRDVKSVRLVCKRFQWDIDYIVGVNAYIDSRNMKSLNWFKTVAIRSCSVNHLKNLHNWDFLGKPHLVRTLKMNDLCAITPEVLAIILNKCFHLRSLSVHFRDDGFSNDGKNEKIIELLERHQKHRRYTLVLLEVTYIPAYRTCRWLIKFKLERPEKRAPKVTDKEDLNIVVSSTQIHQNEANFPSNTKYLNLNFEHYSGFDGLSYSKNCVFWKRFLESQVNLKVMICNFGPTCWDVYAQVIHRNATTLTKIALSNLGCFDFWDELEDQQCPFNWNFFSVCRNLTYLSIASENGQKFGPPLYTAIKPCEMNLRVLHCNFGLVFWEIYMSIVTVNLNTLEDITLLRMTTWDKVKCLDTPFDWNIIAHCRTLKSLVIGGEHLTFLETINFSSIPTKGLRKLQLYWVALTSENVSHMIKYMTDLETTFDFLDWCSIDKVYRSEDTKEIVRKFRRKRNWYPSLNSVKKVVSALPIPELAATTWLFWVKPEV